MKDLIKEFLELLGYCVLVVCFLFAAYLILINLYHYREISTTQQRNFATEENYVKVKTTVDKIKSDVATVNISELNSNKVSAATMIRDGINSCVAAIEEGDFYKLSEKQVVSMKDIYDANKDLYNNLNNKCLFFIPYYVQVSTELYGVDHSFNKMETTIKNRSDQISEYSSYLLDISLNNSSYHYITSVSRYTIFNELNSLTNLTISNYNELVNAVNLASDWYVSEYGGNL